MESFKEINALTRQPNGSGSLSRTSGKQPNAAMGMHLVELMAQAQSYYPNQTLPDGTPDMYLRAWEEMAEQYGMHRFEAALWKALRKSRFFPSPVDIEEECAAARPVENPRAAIEKLNAEAADRAANPDKYVPLVMADLFKEAAERIAAKRSAKESAPLVDQETIDRMNRVRSEIEYEPIRAGAL